MPRDVRNYRVFISSPGDVEQQRRVAKAAVESASSTLLHRDILVTPWLWETDASSTFGTSAQEAIWEQLGEYDIYIGIMGARFGSPTRNFGSGTEEEFDCALKAHAKGKLLRVSFMFKNVALETANLDEASLNQLKKIQEFKSRIGSSGIYHHFTEDHELTNYVQRIVADAIAQSADADAATGLQYSLMSSSSAPGVPTLSKEFFSETLNKLDEDLTNGTRLRLTLDDVWVDPDLRLFSGDREAERGPPGIYTFDRLLSDLTDGKSIVVSGDDKAGKSCLCRRVMLKAREAGYFPVFLVPEKLNNLASERLMQRVRAACMEQYDNLTPANLDKISKDRIILIIDDFDHAKMQHRRVAEVLQAALGGFRSILLSTGPTFDLRMLGKPELVEALSAFQKVQIKDIGHSRRYNLIERWCQAGRVDPLRQDELSHQVELRRAVINRVLSTGLVPRTPLIVLILLQAMEAGHTGDLARTGYVRYYKYLIDSAILKNATREVAEIAYELLPEVAWATYRDRADALSAEHAERLLEDLSSRRALRKTDLYSALTSMRRIGMFDEHGSAHRFKNRYAYYFFLSDYIAKRLDDPEMRAEVRQLCATLSLKESSDILIFLSFHSNNEIIIETVMEGLSMAFAESGEFEFSSERTAPVNKLIFEAPKQIVDGDYRRNRTRRLELEDRIEEQLDSVETDAKPEEKHTDVEQAATEMSVTFNAIEILGHVIRNHYARLDAGPKRRVVEVTTAASLRCLGSLFDYLSASVDDLTAAMAAFTSGIDQNASEAAKLTRAKRLVFLIAVALLGHVMRHLSRAIGDENLDLTYKQAFGEDADAARAFAQLAIKLDCYRDFPLQEVKQLAQVLHGNGLGQTALRWFVAERIDMRPPAPGSELQRICDAAGLDLKQRLIARPKV